MAKKKVATKKAITLENAEVTLKSAIQGDPKVIDLSERLRDLTEKEHEIWREETKLENLYRGEQSAKLRLEYRQQMQMNKAQREPLLREIDHLKQQLKDKKSQIRFHHTEDLRIKVYAETQPEIDELKNRVGELKAQQDAVDRLLNNLMKVG